MTVERRSPRPGVAGLHLMHRYHAHLRLLREFQLAPGQEGAGGPALFRV